jgi:oligopeptide/dipeptide ABC transporter ATP-binding protein
MIGARPLLVVTDLAVSYPGSTDRFTAVDGVSFSVAPGERFGLVGQSGSGKSTTAMAILRLLRPPGLVERGRITLEGVDLLAADATTLRETRWRRLALVPQGSMNALNPVMRVHDQIADAIVAHEEDTERSRLRRRVGELLESVRLSPSVADRYPHELSGGMRQRVCIAMAIALGPRLLIADEPTSALDVIVQRAVAETLLDATTDLGAALVLIGHDLALQAQMVDRLGVMRAGRLIEVGPVRRVFHTPAHSYTRALIAAVPSIRNRPRLLRVDQDGPEGTCAFAPGCPAADEIRSGVPRIMHEAAPGHFVVCGLTDARDDIERHPGLSA